MEVDEWRLRALGLTGQDRTGQDTTGLDRTGCSIGASTYGSNSNFVPPYEILFVKEWDVFVMGKSPHFYPLGPWTVAEYAVLVQYSVLCCAKLVCILIM